jgi:hypothetical protein
VLFAPSPFRWLGRSQHSIRNSCRPAKKTCGATGTPDQMLDTPRLSEFSGGTRKLARRKQRHRHVCRARSNTDRERAASTYPRRKISGSGRCFQAWCDRVPQADVARRLTTEAV